MKIYYFDRDSGLYQGEEFENDALIPDIDEATTVAPPSWQKGEIPVFDPAAREWVIRSVAEVSRQTRLSEENHGQNLHDATRKR